MANNNKPKYPFRRRLDNIKDIVYQILGGDSKKIPYLIEGLSKITPVKKFFSQKGSFVDIGNNQNLSSISLDKLRDDPLETIEENRYYAYLFPSDLVRALSHLAMIFVKKESLLTEFAKGELFKVKSWGDFDTGYKTIDEVAFIEHYEDIIVFDNNLLKDKTN